MSRAPLAVIVLGTRSWRIARANPVVPGAVPPPELIYPQIEPFRRCACGMPAACVEVTQRKGNGIRMGRDYRYACSTCGRRFEVSDALGSVTWGAATLILTGVVALMAMKPPEGFDLFGWGCMGLTVLLLLFAVFVLVRNTVNRVRFPETGAPRPPGA